MAEPDPEPESFDALFDQTINLGDAQSRFRELDGLTHHSDCLIVIAGAGQGKRYFIGDEEAIAGRHPKVEIYIPDKSISRMHAAFRKNENKITVMDLGSSNGTLWNDKRMEPYQERTLHKGDIITLGETILKFFPEGEPETMFYEKMETQVYRDSLTSIHNRRFMQESLEVEFKRSKLLDKPLSLLFFDIDLFKKINDTFSHEAGDQVLAGIAKLIKHNIRDNDMLARYGGDEFVTIFVNTDKETAMRRAESIRHAVEHHDFMFEGERIPVTCSIGLAHLDASIDSHETLIRLADKALYQAKEDGRNCVVSNT